MMNKRGDLSTIIILIVILLGISVGAIIFAKVFLDITGELKQQEQLPNKSIDTINHVEGRTIPLLDFFVFFSFISLCIGLIVASIYIPVPPGATAIVIVGVIIATFLAAQFTNVFVTITENAELSTTATQFTFTNTIFGQYFPFIVLMVGVIMIVILFGKPKQDLTPV